MCQLPLIATCAQLPMQVLLCSIDVTEVSYIVFGGASRVAEEKDKGINTTYFTNKLHETTGGSIRTYPSDEAFDWKYHYKVSFLSEKL